MPESAPDQNCELQSRPAGLLRGRSFTLVREFVDVGESGVKDSRSRQNFGPLLGPHVSGTLIDLCPARAESERVSPPKAPLWSSLERRRRGPGPVPPPCRLGSH